MDDDIEMPSAAFVSHSKARVADVEREDEICGEEIGKIFMSDTQTPTSCANRFFNVASVRFDTVYANPISAIHKIFNSDADF